MTPSRSTISSALSPSKRGIMVTQAPAVTAAFIVQVWPKVWNRGSAPSSTSSGEKSPRVLTTVRQFFSRFSWVSSAPFGWPVVPEV